ncbi:MAG: hypothetical protein ACE5EM_02945 [Sphingomonadales bacterium]
MKVADNPADLGAILGRLATRTGAHVFGVDNSWITEGPNFGSNNVVSLPKARVAIAWDAPTAPYAAGNTRFVVERQFDYPVTAIRARLLRNADLSRFDVLILPDQGRFFGSSYAETLGPAGAENLRTWVKSGGVLIAIGGAARYAADPEVDLLAIRRENATHDSQGREKSKGKTTGMSGENGKSVATVPGTHITDDSSYRSAIAPNKAQPDSVAGVLARAVVDEDHWLAAGVASTLNVLVRGTDIYQPIRLDKGVNVARFDEPGALLVSGHMWDENRVQLAFKPFVVVQPTGRGFVIGFTQDPAVRAYLDGLNLILANAIFRGPGHARPMR